MGYVIRWLGESHPTLAYLCEGLREGKTLSRFLTGRCCRNEGYVSVIVPRQTEESAIFAFTRGGLRQRGDHGDHTEGGSGHYSTADSALESLIARFLVQAPNALCVIEDFSARCNDKALARFDTQYACFGPEVYHFLTYEDARQLRLGKTLLLSASLPSSVICLTSTSEDHQTPQQLNESILRAFSDSAAVVALSAYDGEGYVLWHTRLLNQYVA